MPIMKAAIKALRQTKRRTERNKLVKDSITFLRRSVRKAIDSGDLKKAETLAKDIVKAVDKAAQNGVLKRNTASRIKSRLASSIKKLASSKK